MLRPASVRLGEEEGVLLFNIYHIVSDGWSMEVLMEESRLYEAYSAGEDSLPELGVQFADCAEWQREWLSGELLEEHLGCCRRGRSHNFRRFSREFLSVG